MSESTIESANREREDMNADWMEWLEYVLETDPEVLNENGLRNIARLLAKQKQQNDELQNLIKRWRNPPSDVPDVAVELVEVCADDLEEVIE
jgi:hypothetical protein